MLQVEAVACNDNLTIQPLLSSFKRGPSNFRAHTLSPKSSRKCEANLRNLPFQTSALFAFNPSPIKIKLHLRVAFESAQFYGTQTFLLAFLLWQFLL